MLRITAFATLLILVLISSAIGETFSIDPASPSAGARAPGTLLNPGLIIQVPYGNLQLSLTDDVDGLSPGNDAVWFDNIVYFSVDRISSGAGVPAGPFYYNVAGQAFLGQQSGDIYVTVDANGQYTVPQGINQLERNQSSLGLVPTVQFFMTNPGGTQDNVDAFTFEQFDLNSDRLPDVPAYFSVSNNSPLVQNAVVSGADILIVDPVLGAGTYAFAAQMGLSIEDDIDALAINDINGDGVATPGVDLALFSLARGSQSLLAGGFSAADVFLTDFTGVSTLRYSAASLGLLATDNVDALEVAAVPEPATLGLLAIGAVGLLIRRKK